MSFKKNSYVVVRNVIDRELSIFLYNYLLIKRQVAKTLFDKKYISPNTDYFGVWNDKQVPNTYSHYSDIAMETLLLKIKPIMEINTELNLIETYSYTRVYKKGDVLKRHKDRPSCEISSTMFLGGDEWPIYVEPNKSYGKNDENGYVPGNTKGIEINLKPGDLLIYRGCDLEHWREPFYGNDCAQVFLHYNDLDSKEINLQNQHFDNRPHLGLPSRFKGTRL